VSLQTPGRERKNTREMKRDGETFENMSEEQKLKQIKGIFQFIIPGTAQ